MPFSKNPLKYALKLSKKIFAIRIFGNKQFFAHLLFS